MHGAARSEADDLRRKSETYLDLAQRAQADFVNYKRRTVQDLEQKIRDANANLLTQQGLEPIGEEGDLFDPRVHEAVAYEEHPVYDEGQVANVYRTGYRLRDRVLRPAQVVVARGSSRPSASAGGESRSVGEGTAHP